MRAVGKVLAAALLVVALAACTTVEGSDPAPVPTGTPERHPTWTSCPAPARDPSIGWDDAIGVPRLDDDFVAVAAMMCVGLPQQRPDGGTGLLITESRAGDVTTLVAALRLPDEPRTRGACTDNGYLLPYLALVDVRGEWERPGWPADLCGKPRAEVLRAVDNLKLTTLAHYAVPA